MCLIVCRFTISIYPKFSHATQLVKQTDLFKDTTNEYKYKYEYEYEYEYVLFTSTRVGLLVLIAKTQGVPVTYYMA